MSCATSGVTTTRTEGRINDTRRPMALATVGGGRILEAIAERRCCIHPSLPPLALARAILAAGPLSRARRLAWAFILSPHQPRLVWAAAPKMGNAPAPRRRFHVGKLEVVYSVGDLTQWRPPNQAVGASAIVNAANEQCLGGGGVDGAVHRAAGGELRKACEQLPVLYGADGNTDDVRCETGKAVITRAFGSLRTTHVVHCVGPNVSGRFDVGNAQQDPELLGEAYRSALRVAGEAGCGSVAFPAVSCGVFGYDVDAAAKVALDSVAVGSVDFVEFVLFSKRTYDTFVAAAVADDRCVEIDQDASAAGASAEEDAFAAGACACASAMRGLVEVQPLAPTGYDTWPIWSCPGVPDPLATFPESQWWRSRPGAAKEKCFVTKGRATLLFDGERLEIKKGDFITFDRGFHCEWRVEEAIEKHYAYFDAVGEAWETTNAE